ISSPSTPASASSLCWRATARSSPRSTSTTAAPRTRRSRPTRSRAPRRHPLPPLPARPPAPAPPVPSGSSLPPPPARRGAPPSSRRPRRSATPAAPVKKLEEIEPEPAVARAKPPPAPVVPPPVDLPEVDGQDFGLEPIAAHSQFGDDVAGQEDLAGDGAAGDAVEGLVSASVASPGAAEARQMDALDAIAAPEPTSVQASGWTAPVETMKSGNGSGGQTGWDVSAPAPDGGWDAESAGASHGWTGPVEGWASPSPSEEQDGWSIPAADGEAEPPTEALPADAILGPAPIHLPSDAGAGVARALE